MGVPNDKSDHSTNLALTTSSNKDTDDSNQIEDNVLCRKDVENKTKEVSKAEGSSFENWCCLSKCTCLLTCFYILAQCIRNYANAGKFMFQTFSLVLYIIDVVTYIINGISQTFGTKVNHMMFGNEKYEKYTRYICCDLLNYSHPFRGSIGIVFVWFPVFTLVPQIIAQWKYRPGVRQNYWLTKLLSILFLILFWPLIGLIL